MQQTIPESPVKVQFCASQTAYTYGQLNYVYVYKTAKLKPKLQHNEPD